VLVLSDGGRDRDVVAGRRDLDRAMTSAADGIIRSAKTSSSASLAPSRFGQFRRDCVVGPALPPPSRFAVADRQSMKISDMPSMLRSDESSGGGEDRAVENMGWHDRVMLVDQDRRGNIDVLEIIDRRAELVIRIRAREASQGGRDRFIETAYRSIVSVAKNLAPLWPDRRLLPGLHFQDAYEVMRVQSCDPTLEHSFMSIGGATDKA